MVQGRLTPVVQLQNILFGVSQNFVPAAQRLGQFAILGMADHHEHGEFGGSILGLSRNRQLSVLNDPAREFLKDRKGLQGFHGLELLGASKGLETTVGRIEKRLAQNDVAG